ncbi:unnamed protein product [Sphagnum balticum]
MDAGSACLPVLHGAGGQVHFYWHPARAQCLAFMYAGCAGNANRFTSKTRCENACKNSDATPCLGNVAAIGGLVAQSCQTLKCPLSFVCKTHANNTTAYCCPRVTEDEQHCTHNTLAYVADDGAVMLAANCSHLRCADGWQCEQSRLFAKCCRRASDSQSQAESEIDERRLKPFDLTRTSRVRTDVDAFDC